MDEKLKGIYFNDETHFVVFTQKAFYWVRREKEIVCPYREITRLNLPENADDINDEREIEVVLKNGDFLFLPVINDTDGFLDIHAVKAGLESWMEAQANIEALSDLISKLKTEVEQYKTQPAGWRQPLPVEYFETLIIYLEDRLSDCNNGHIRMQTVAQEDLSLNQKDTWRLMAEVLLAPKTFRRD